MSTPALNPPSQRFPFDISGKVHPEVEKAIRWTFNGLTNHEQAFAALGKSAGTTSTTTTTPSAAAVSATETVIINQVAANNTIGYVNDQTGNTAYTTTQSDYGKFIILNDASPVAITLSTFASSLGIVLPWYATFINEGAGVVTLTPFTGTINGVSFITLSQGNAATISFDGVNFEASVTAGAGVVVRSLNGETGTVSIVAGAGITVTPAGSNITVAATGSSGTALLSPDGYQTFGSGLILQWGSTFVDTNPNITFPIAFPNACLQSYAITYGTTDRITYVVQGTVTTTGMTVANNGSGAFANWLAIGF